MYGSFPIAPLFIDRLVLHSAICLFILVDTYGGNADGATCVFPFHYNGTWHAECTKRNHDRLWCATTANYDIHHKWGNCVVGGSIRNHL